MLDTLANTLVLGSLLAVLQRRGGYELHDHWQQGEFHHDVVLRVPAGTALPGEYLVVATNCNGGVKEVLCFAELPTRGALWHWRCPSSSEFEGTLSGLLGTARTLHWFDPCELLLETARSEIREEFRQRVAGGGWAMSVPGGACGKKG